MRSLPRHIFFAAALASCDGRVAAPQTGEHTGPGPTDTGSPPTSSGGWCAVQGLFQRECLACHSAASALGGLDLETDPYGALVDQPSIAYSDLLVAPGDSAASLLYRKIAAAPSLAEGDPMPPPTGADAADAAAVQVWIDAGATEDCGSPPTGTPPSSYHPAGFADAAAHGLEAKLQAQDCRSCHGADLTGGSVGVSCDTCHDAVVDDWRMTCTFCHGGTDGDATGAPPENIDDSVDPVVFAPHRTHVHTALRAELTCSECHQEPTEALSPGHVFVDDATAGVAEVAFLGVSSGGSYDASGPGTCTVYCHGDGQTKGTVSADDGPRSCSSCHPSSSSSVAAWTGMSGRHRTHLEDVGADCATCHPTTADDRTIARPDLHIDGEPDVDIGADGGSVAWDGQRCTGACHDKSHRGCTWQDCP